RACDRMLAPASRKAARPRPPALTRDALPVSRRTARFVRAHEPRAPRYRQGDAARLNRGGPIATPLAFDNPSCSPCPAAAAPRSPHQPAQGAQPGGPLDLIAREDEMPSRWSARRTRFRGILAGGACVHPASVHDAVSARIAADLGFELGMFAGSVASLAVLGAPDLIVLTLSEFADQAHRIGRAAELPLLVDADHGYGNALNVMRTVEELETAGVAALSIEDTDLPRRYGPSETAELLSLEEGVGKMNAALAARRDPDLVIAGRTSAMAITGVEDATRRAKAYEAAGLGAH